MKSFRLLTLMAICVLVLAACRPGTPNIPPTIVNVMVHDSFAASEDVVGEFQAAYNVKLNFIWSGDVGALVNRAILTKNAPLADVLYGVDNTFLSRALDAGIFEPYRSPVLANIRSDTILDLSLHVLPVDYGDVCLNYDRAYFAAKKLAVPQSFEDLLKPAYKGLMVVQNPATSSPGLAFLLATVAHFGPEKFLDYWKGLKANGLVVVNDWETAYYTNFSGSSGRGGQPLVVSYSSSPAAEIYFAKDKPKDAPTAAITATGMCFRQVEFAGILSGTLQRALAQNVIDFLLSVAFQEDMPLQMFVYPANNQAVLPDLFLNFSRPAEKPASLSPDEIAKNRETWLQAWKDTVLK